MSAIMAGAGDEIADPDRQAKRLHEAIPHSELRILPGQGHMLHHFAADQVVEAADTVLERVEEPKAA
jgi:pimeloyl-ACP methyl ester carboxylesterase